MVAVTPLTALILVQKERFSHTGLRVEFVGSAQDNERAIEEALNGTVQLVYVNPESILNSKKFTAMLQKEIYQERHWLLMRHIIVSSKVVNIYKLVGELCMHNRGMLFVKHLLNQVHYAVFSLSQ